VHVCARRTGSGGVCARYAQRRTCAVLPRMIVSGPGRRPSRPRSRRLGRAQRLPVSFHEHHAAAARGTCFPHLSPPAQSRTPGSTTPLHPRAPRPPALWPPPRSSSCQKRLASTEGRYAGYARPAHRRAYGRRARRRSGASRLRVFMASSAPSRSPRAGHVLSSSTFDELRPAGLN
jgi:hypothetical protein